MPQNQARGQQFLIAASHFNLILPEPKMIEMMSLGQAVL
jgi:hypothetical protein